MGGIGIGMTFKQPAPAAGGEETPWYLAGGVSAENCIAAYQAKGAASYEASKINLINPGVYNATTTGFIGVNEPSWTVAGWAFNGGHAIKLIDDSILPSLDYCMICKYKDIPLLDPNSVLRIISSTAILTDDYVNSLSIVRNIGGQYRVRYETGESVASFYDDVLYSSGVIAQNSNSILAVSDCYHDGILVNTIDGAMYEGDTGIFYAGAYYSVFSNELQEFLIGTIESSAFYNISLTSEQIIAITTAMQAL